MPKDAVEFVECDIHTFKPSGKWYASARGKCQTDIWRGNNRERMLALNDGKCPGLSGRGDDFIIVVITNEDCSGIPFLSMPKDA